LYCLNPFRPSCHFTFHATVLIQQTQHKHPCPRWDSNPRAAKDPRLRPHGHWDQFTY
jgi:hypothetical protein